MYFQLIISYPFESKFFNTLDDAKKYVIAFHEDTPSLIRHRINDRTTCVTTYLPRSGFKTETAEEIYKGIFKKQDCN